MFCPNCKAEYLAGVKWCSDCDVALVDSLEESGGAGKGQAKGEGEELRLLPVWSGDDPSEFAAVKAALEKAEIPFLDESREGYFLFPSFLSKLQVRVSSADLDRADRVVREALEAPATEESAGSGKNVAATPHAAGAAEGEEEEVATEYPPEEPDEKEEITEVWQGDDESTAAAIVACFQENGIASRKVSGENFWRLLVRPQDEARAKEIAREVVEGTPPA
jgi:hypothetical protein